MLSVLPLPAGATNYHDISAHWANSEIIKWSDNCILQGTNGYFRPNDPITRGEMAVILNLVMKYQDKPVNNFSDLDENFYTDAILGANKANIILGNANLIRPQDNITREEAVVMLSRALGLPESKVKSPFSDAYQISSWAQGYVNAMADKKLISGFNGMFYPQAHITRAEMVAILDNNVKGFYYRAGEYSGNVSGTVVVNTSGVILETFA